MQIEKTEGFPCEGCKNLDTPNCCWRKCAAYKKWFRVWWRKITGALK